MERHKSGSLSRGAMSIEYRDRPGRLQKADLVAKKMASPPVTASEPSASTCRIGDDQKAILLHYLFGRARLGRAQEGGRHRGAQILGPAAAAKARRMSPSDEARHIAALGIEFLMHGGGGYSSGCGSVPQA